MKVKVCGMRQVENIKGAALLQVDLIGLIFYPKSPRCLNGIDPRAVIEATSDLQRVGVFVDAELEEVLEKARVFELEVVQLHGSESPAYITRLKSANPQLQVFKAFAVGEVLPATDAYQGICDAFLFDTRGAKAGGNGTRFDWSLLDQYEGPTPFFLSGGIGIDALAQLVEFQHPFCLGIDLNSQFESRPGIKRLDVLDTFLMDLHAMRSGKERRPLKV